MDTAYHVLGVCKLTVRPTGKLPWLSPALSYTPDTRADLCAHGLLRMTAVREKAASLPTWIASLAGAVHMTLVGVTRRCDRRLWRRQPMTTSCVEDLLGTTSVWNVSCAAQSNLHEEYYYT
jgi:hypothetical protein